MSTRCPQRLRKRRAARPESVAPLRGAVVSFAARNGASERQCEDVALAVSEALSNAVLHAYVGRERPGEMQVEAWVDDDGLQIAVSDDGVGMLPRPDSPGLGLGLALIGQVADAVRVVSRGTAPGVRLWMTFASA